MRLFVALQTPESLHPELCRALARLQTIKHRNINWVKPENLHLTVNFIGEVPEHRTPEIAQELAAQATKHRALKLHAEGFELFPPRSPRLIWLKLGGDTKALTALNRQILESLQKLDIDADTKKLKPHITIGRLKEQQSLNFERSVMGHWIPSETTVWDKLTLYRSALSPKGPRYDLIEQFNLQ